MAWVVENETPEAKGMYDSSIILMIVSTIRLFSGSKNNVKLYEVINGVVMKKMVRKIEIFILIILKWDLSVVTDYPLQNEFLVLIL